MSKSIIKKAVFYMLGNIVVYHVMFPALWLLLKISALAQKED